MRLQTISVAAMSAHLVRAQVPLAAPHDTGFNSSFTLTSAQIESAGLSDDLAASVNNVVRFDRSQYANGGPRYDTFYSLPPLVNDTQLEPGKLLKVEAVTAPTAFALPPSTALSRILYTTELLNGTVVPASAFVLWPFVPREHGQQPAGAAPVVLWLHATSGVWSDWAPSAHRGLWHANAAPFTLAQAGYAVVAPDYAGLGVGESWDGSEIPHAYLNSPVAAINALDALIATRETGSALPAQLSDEFVVAGHSQGGGGAWAVAEALAKDNDGGRFSDLVDGYRGAVAGSPTTRVFSALPAFVAPWVGEMLHTIFPDFDIEKWLTPLGIARANLSKEIQGGIGIAQQLFMTSNDLVKPDYEEESWHAAAYANLSDVGGRAIRGPMLVIQGTGDVIVPYDVTAETVQDTWDFLEQEGASGQKNCTTNKDLEFVVVPGVGHIPALEATRSLWLQWIGDRFDGKPVPVRGAVRTEWESFLPVESYQAIGTSFLQWAGLPEFNYELPLGL